MEPPISAPQAAAHSSDSAAEGRRGLQGVIGFQIEKLLNDQEHALTSHPVFLFVFISPTFCFSQNFISCHSFTSLPMKVFFELLKHPRHPYQRKVSDADLPPQSHLGFLNLFGVQPLSLLCRKFHLIKREQTANL